MSDGLFAKFPTIAYGGTECLDLTRRVAMPETTLRRPEAFYPHELSEDQRSDVVAFGYYDDPMLDWLVYLSNGVVDPYYGWYLSEDQLNSLVTEKYGSVAEAQRRIRHWETNWADAVGDASVDYYRTHMPASHKKYWSPFYGYGARVVSYRRRQETWTTTTNVIASVGLTGQTGVFRAGEIVVAFVGGLETGRADLVRTEDDGTLVVRHVVESVPVGAQVRGDVSGATATVASYAVEHSDFPLDEAAYWSPVYYYEWERQRNEANKFVQLLDKGWVATVSQEVSKKLRS